jgi:lipoate-protein ligase B
MSQHKICRVYKLRFLDYLEAWELQNSLADEIAAGKHPPALLLLEHPHTFTFGRRGNSANLLWEDNELKRRGVTVHWIDRGGDVTYHGPGQLVGYPIMPLKTPVFQGTGNQLPKTDYVDYIRNLERILILALKELNVESTQIEGLTGVWVQNQLEIAKLAAIGVKVDARGITRHGFALNVDPDMSYWEGIIGCGLTHPEISLAQLKRPVPSLKDVQEVVIEAFSQIFNFEIVMDA